MMKPLSIPRLVCLLVFCLSLLASLSASPEAGNKSPVLLTVMQHELQRAKVDLGKLEPAPYFISYSAKDQVASVVIASEGSLVNSTQAHTRTADVIVRIGSPALDNTHGVSRYTALRTNLLPLQDDPDAIAHVLWQLTYSGYRTASSAYLNVKTKNQVDAQEEDASPDFSLEKPTTYLEASHEATRELAPAADKKLEQAVRLYSAAFRKYPYIYQSMAMASSQNVVSYFVSTEGSRVVASTTLVRLAIQAQTRAADGMELMRVETFQADTASDLPSEAEVTRLVEKMASDLDRLRTAPLAEPFEGPALLSARAAAVFFHEVLGHRLEGQRQRGEQEGQTFTKRINQSVLPAFLSVVDDPTQRTLNGVELSGWYQYDDEGEPAQRVEVVKDGVLKNFLMSRMPIKGFDQSNGHGRAQAGAMPVGRQGNLIITSSSTIPDAELRQRLLDEVKRQGKSYGLYFEDIEGGFTLTQRGAPQVFQVLPILVWRVYADGRPDELVRGVDIVGTPLTAMTHIMVTGDHTAVFNGVCGAESGAVPVSAASPAVLMSEIEVQKRKHTLMRPPILPPPGFENSPDLKPADAGGRQ